MARRKSSSAKDLVFLPWWLNGILAILSFAIFTKPLPALAVVVSLFFIAMAFLSALRASLNSRRLEQQTGVESLHKLGWKQFENLLGEAYRRQGYAVKETLGGGADGGVDLVLRRNGETILVQCKRWKEKPVPVQTVRELFGVLTDCKANAAKLVATTRFTSDAAAFARGKAIELVDSQALLQLIRGVQRSGNVATSMIPENSGVVEAQRCPKCGSAMVLREARRGQNQGSKFWGCQNFPRCRGTRDLIL